MILDIPLSVSNIKHRVLSILRPSSPAILRTVNILFPPIKPTASGLSQFTNDIACILLLPCDFFKFPNKVFISLSYSVHTCPRSECINLVLNQSSASDYFASKRIGACRKIDLDPDDLFVGSVVAAK